jgi:siroheme synthase (precorrin-2 oxidase/ferrochelatase)
LIEALLPTRIGELAELIGRHRRRFAAVPRVLSPRRFWQNVIAGPIAEAIWRGARRRRRRSSSPRSTQAALAKAASSAKPKRCFWSAQARAIPTF